MGSSSSDAPPSLRKPSQSYVDSYIARRPDPSPSARAATAISAGSESTRGGPAGRHTPRIFYALERECPRQYYPDMHVVEPRTMGAVRFLLVVLCLTQIGVSVGMFYVVSATNFLHDPLKELFTQGVASLCAFAACAGLLGVCSSSRGMLLFFYINQLWSLSNVSTFAVINLSSADQSTAACELFRQGELTAAQMRSRGLDCAEMERTEPYVLWGAAILMVQLWASCFMSKIYSEMLQDRENDEQDRALVNFIWQRRGETWTKLEKFEDVVQRQFEELRALRPAPIPLSRAPLARTRAQP